MLKCGQQQNTDYFNALYFIISVASLLCILVPVSVLQVTAPSASDS